MKDITLSNGMKVSKAKYAELKTKDLIEFGYSTLTEKEVLEQVDKILKGDTNLNVIGRFCEDDISKEQ